MVSDLVVERLRVARPVREQDPSKVCSSRKVAVCGNTVTAAPAAASRCRIERFAAVVDNRDSALPESLAT